MIRIGKFARLAGVSVKTLRLYSDIGLLPPSSVDRWTGYRMYGYRQLAAVRRIQTLRELGFSLGRIRSILDNPGCVRGPLLEQRTVLAREAEAASWRLAQLDRALASTSPDPIEIRVHRSLPFHAVGLRDHLSTYEELDLLFHELDVRLKERAIPRGRVAAWHPQTSTSGRIDAEALVVVDATCPGAVEIPARDVVSTLYAGDSWQDAYRRLTTWLDEQRFSLAGPKMEHLLLDDLVEVQFPIRQEVA